MRISDWSSDVCSSDLLRVEGGGLKLAVPVAYDYLTGSVSTEARQMALSPSGREIDVEASYGFSLGGGRIDAHAYWRKDPGHIAGAPNDTGVALRYRLARSAESRIGAAWGNDCKCRWSPLSL